jgi:cytochrome P450
MRSGACSFLPFGGGARRCLGASLALLEIEIVLHEMLARLELAPVSPALARPVPRGPTLAPRGGGRVRVVAKHSASRKAT